MGCAGDGLEGLISGNIEFPVWQLWNPTGVHTQQTRQVWHTQRTRQMWHTQRWIVPERGLKCGGY